MIKKINPMRDYFDEEKRLKLNSFTSAKHPKSICIVNYKGGVGKTTISCLLGYYISQHRENIKRGRDSLKKRKKLLLLDIDPQCSLSLAVGFDPEDVNKTDFTMYNLVKPTKWAKFSKTNFDSYVKKVPDSLAPSGLYIIPGSFDIDKLDMEIAMSIAKDGERRKIELFLYCKQMLNHFYKDYEFVIIDCPPNKMFLTQAMLRACMFYLPVTIPDAISCYGMPRLMRWVKQIERKERPLMLGYVLNAINRTGGHPAGKVVSQQSAEHILRRDIQRDLLPVEKQVLGKKPMVGQLPRLDKIAKFLSEKDSKFQRYEFSKKTSDQPSVDECLTNLVRKTIERIKTYNA